MMTMAEFTKQLKQAVLQAEERIQPRFRAIERIEEINQNRTLQAFWAERVSEQHLQSTTGYGYGDIGRNTLDKVFARMMGSEDALVRPHWVSGTHALTTALFGILRPGDVLFSATGTPYDTLHEVIGMTGEKGSGSLADFGISFDSLPFEGQLDTEAILAKLNERVRVVYLQRSRGYAARRTLMADEITALTVAVHRRSPQTVVMVDNCYGEFVEAAEPQADLLVGSLIKNPGGGLCPCGGYIAGKHELVELCAGRLTSPGIGREVGASLGLNRLLYQGIFIAPHTTAQALKTAVFAAALFEILGFSTTPGWNEERGDIIQLLELGNPERLCAFCKGLQSGSPIDSHVTPEPWDMPGYDSPVIMAAGGFNAGASIEISADAPLREPFCVYLQGGLTYASAKAAIIRAAAETLRIS